MYKKLEKKEIEEKWETMNIIYLIFMVIKTR